jgi:hypothetical protein
VAGLLIIGFGKVQDLRSPEWWGELVTEQEALQMPSWGPQGRISEAPLKPLSFEIGKNLSRAFRPTGTPLWPAGMRAFQRHGAWFGAAFLLAVGAGASIAAWRRRRAPADPAAALQSDAPAAAVAPAATPWPWQLLLVAVAAFLAYLLARAVAFKLYLPYRTLQHSWPYLMYVGMPLLLWCVAERLWPRRRTMVAAAAAIGGVIVACTLWGHGVSDEPKTYQSYANGAPFYTKIRSLPDDAVFAGDFTHVAVIPLFGAHRVYVNKNLAHPFRQGFYAETERRILRMYRALYATELSEVVAFGREEGVRYLMFHTRTFAGPDKRLFMPPKRELDALFRANKKAGFALAKPPKEAVVWRSKAGDRFIIDIDELKDGAVTAPAEETAPGSPGDESDGVDDAPAGDDR